MDIHLERALDPTLLGERECNLCELAFVAGSVEGATFDLEGLPVCPVCVEYFGKRNPEKFPTIQELEEAKQRFPEPMFASEEELCQEGPWLDHTNSEIPIER